MAEPGKQGCLFCGENAVSLLQGAVAVMTTSNTQLLAEVADLQSEIARLKSLQSQPHYPDTPSTPGCTETSSHLKGKAATPGAGAGSPEIYREMAQKHWHGRLGRAHMSDIDALPPTALKELDIFLRRSINTMFPVGGGYAAPNPSAYFATLSAFGIRLEDRGPLADVNIDHDNGLHGEPTIRRLTNFSAYYYSTDNFSKYWLAVVLETVMEIAKYRGLFTKDGFLKAE